MATKEKSDRERIAQLESTLRAMGVAVEPKAAAERPEDRADYIAFGSPEHAAFLGIIEVDGNSADGRITYTSTGTKKTYMLEDEITPFMSFSDPSQVARLVLRQKVSTFEAGPPKVPANAPPLWQPINLR